MPALRFTALIILTVILITAGWAYLFYVGAERTVLSTVYYREVLEETDVQDYFHEQMQEEIMENILEDLAGNMPDQTGEEEKEDGLLQQQDGVFLEDIPWEHILERPPEDLIREIVQPMLEVFHVEWMEEQLLLAVDDYVAYLEGRQEEFTMELDLTEPREQLLQKISSAVEEWSSERLREMEIEPGFVEPVVEMILEQLEFPDTMVLSEMEGEVMPPEVEEAASQIAASRPYLQVIPLLIAIVVLGLNCCLAGLYGGIKWFAGGFLLTGSTFLAALQALPVLAGLSLGGGRMEEAPAGNDTVVSLVEITVSRASIMPGVVAGAGLLLIAIAVFLDRRRRV